MLELQSLLGGLHRGRTMYFDASYREVRTLLDGSRVILRRLVQEDREKLSVGFTRLSLQSRYLRFLSPKQRLSERELRFLTDVDGIHHFGIVAVRCQLDGTEGEGLGVGRFVRSPDEPAVAEPAITVVDAVQGHGLGRLLCCRITAAAVERGISTFSCWFLQENRRIKRVLLLLFPRIQFELKGNLVNAQIDLSSFVEPDWVR
ncbi:MAG: hypothetical protein JSU96_11625 [Acidobacteriota bacterium]|nr:MAG: hypothetical protein JSU96_11625 [Acidobacteriota bacterium]